MPKFSKSQLASIAQQYHDLSVAVAQFRLNQIHSGAPLDDPGVVQLLGLQWSLQNASNSFYVQAAGVVLDDADKAVALITKATKTANEAIRTLKAVDKVVAIASAAGLVLLAAMTGNTNQIASAVETVCTGFAVNAVH